MPILASGNIDRLSLHGQRLYRRLYLLDHRTGQRREIQRSGELLTVVTCPPETLDQRPTLVCILLILVEQQVCEAADRVGAAARCVGDRNAEVIGYLDA